MMYPSYVGDKSSGSNYSVSCTLVRALEAPRQADGASFQKSAEDSSTHPNRALWQAYVCRESNLVASEEAESPDDGVAPSLAPVRQLACAPFLRPDAQARRQLSGCNTQLTGVADQAQSTTFGRSTLRLRSR
jgi:hypothetical protein